jgi:uncharacterized membrane protein YgcG
MTELTHHPAFKRVTIALIAFVLFGGMVALVTQDRGLAPGEARLHTNGIATVQSPDGHQRAVRGTALLHTGDIVEAVQGDLKLDLPDESAVEGRAPLTANATDAQPTRLKVADRVEVLAGDALVTAQKGTEIDAGGNRVHLDRSSDVSAARVSRSLTVVAGVYRGHATLDSAGQLRDINALRQFDVAALGRPAGEPKPLQVRDGDPWDRRFLGEAMDLTATLDDYAAGYSSRALLTPGEGRTAGFYRSVLPVVADQQDFFDSMIDEKRAGAPGETLVGAAIAGLGQRDSFAQRWSQVFSFHDDDAGWGLVALDQGVSAEPLLRAMQEALNSSPLLVAATRVPGADGTTDTTATTVGGTAATSGSGGSSGTASGSAAASGGSSGSGTGSGSGSGSGVLPGTTLPAIPGTPTTPPPTTTPPTLPPVLPPILPPVLPPPTTQPPPSSGTGPTGNPVVDGVVDTVNDLLGGTLPN